jgi:hypothetical protein
MVVKTFRGLLADGGQDRIRLQTNKGKTGYKIIKFQIMANLPGTASQESLVQIMKTETTTVPTSTPTVNFSDSDVLAAAYYHGGTGTGDSYDSVVIFDNEIFNQDVYVTHTEGNGTEACNYYLELEVIPLSENAAEYTTLKDIRGRNTT